MKYRAIFLSDIHLGTRGSQVKRLLNWLRGNEADTIYLVGDIIDGWALSRSWFWPTTHNNVVQKLLRNGQHGTRIVYIPGNHDEFLRAFTGHAFGGVELKEEAVHIGANGDQYLVLHGDRFDEVIQHMKWLAILGDIGYDLLMWLNRWNSKMRNFFRLPHWSLSAAVKHRVKLAVSYIGNYESALSGECKRHGFQGVICGHIHHAEIKEMHGVAYMNTGDWVESCTALVEHLDGRFEIVRAT